MSWSRYAARASLALGITAMVGFLAGCGYTPLYGSMGHGGKVSEAMRQVAVPTVASGLVGLDVRNELLDSMGVDGSPIAPAQRLEVTVTPTVSGLLVQPDAAVTRYNYTLVGNYRLVDTKTNAVLTEGQVYGQSAYNVVISEYATVVARRDAERRAAHNVSDELAMRMAIYFKQ
jgi:LPS-assembly lipoprotein